MAETPDTPEVDEVEVAQEEAPAPEVDQAPQTDELAELTEDLQRLSAEYTNYRRRTERERQAAVDEARIRVIAELVPMSDDLVLAKQHGDLEEGPLKAFADKFHATLSTLGVAAFGEPGEPFDPEIHEAVQDLSEGEDKVLGTILRQGFRVRDRIVRPAMVVIADKSEDTDVDKQEEPQAEQESEQD